jgi:threonine aldolase
VGSVLCGRRELIAKARRWRKVLGGGMRQAGVLAAAGLYALQNHVERLKEDHANARALEQGLAQLPGVRVAPAQTNMVFMSVEPSRSARLREWLKGREMLIGAGYGTTRLVTHLDVDQRDVQRFVGAMAEFAEKAA